MDQALKSLMASEEEAVTSPDLSGHRPSLSSPSPPPQAALSQPAGVGRPGASSLPAAVTLTTLLFSSLLPPRPHCATLHCLPHCALPSTLPHTPAVNVGT